MLDSPATGTTSGLKSSNSLRAWLEEASQTSSTNKAGKDEKADVLPWTDLPHHHGDTGMIGHFTKNPTHPVLTLPLFPSNTGEALAAKHTTQG